MQKRLQDLIHLSEAAYLRDADLLAQQMAMDARLQAELDRLSKTTLDDADLSQPGQIALRERWVVSRGLSLQRQRAAVALEIAEAKARAQHSFGRWLALSRVHKR